MKLQYLRSFIVLVAGLITLIMNIKTGKEVTASLLTLLVVLLVFYVLATLIVEILQHYMNSSNQSEGNIELAKETDMEEEEQAEAEPQISFDEEEM